MQRVIVKIFYNCFQVCAVAAFFGLSFPALALEHTNCIPLYPVFCKNVHVGCAGRTSLPTLGFSITQKGEMGIIEFLDGSSVNAKIMKIGGELIFRLLESQSWIRIEEDGRFSHRVYNDGTSAMSIGQCS